MADERDRWLDSAAADKLLRGEPAEPVGPDADPRDRREAARLRAALDALAGPPPATGELPGEAAAVAAFLAARGGSAATPASTERSERRESAAFSGEPLVDIGRASAAFRVPAPRRARTVRFGLAAALASVAVGGLAAAAGAGLLDQSRHDTAGPGPAMSVSADGVPTPGDGSGASTLSPQLRPTPLRDGASPSASTGPTQQPGTSASGTASAGGFSSGTPATGGTGKDGKDGKSRTDGTPDFFGGDSKDRDQDRENMRRAVDLCKDYRSGRLNDDRRERLSHLARGLARIPSYCGALLDGVVDDGKRMDSPGMSVGGTGAGSVKAPTVAPPLPGASAALPDRLSQPASSSL
ncbi:hypothetical protein OG429_23685 [Streptomyces sp. NBC_00190]|uniref:hypothetical protein n=1 Tax=unclassified Streptomyces TaxID=2593676 RepID=UPI002E28E15C|nr:hypothetical protein [Streptomyces sp. NBC_00190]WSZ42030.1 hypothetical protein OG239_26455 [Streptomyces sp. NBC_00868]